jgi:hypothetical protein
MESTVCGRPHGEISIPLCFEPVRIGGTRSLSVLFERRQNLEHRRVSARQGWLVLNLCSLEAESNAASGKGNPCPQGHADSLLADR